MSSERQRSDDESPSTSSGSSDADQRDPPVPESEEQEEKRQTTPPQQQKKATKLSSKTTAKLSSSAKRIQKELAEITLDPPPNCRWVFGSVRPLYGVMLVSSLLKVSAESLREGSPAENAREPVLS
ncbi:ubiquitin-conjugating enzyme E2 E3 [Hoplias malabaricus]|uniref:ubiquitin-conjugating enzyme E2 E3 n=1 Tax=Hoplias malabaricus TaxID=27720 RepID=UPI0034618D03